MGFASRCGDPALGFFATFIGLAIKKFLPLRKVNWEVKEKSERSSVDRTLLDVLYDFSLEWFTTT